MITLKKINKYFNHYKKNEIHVINDTSLELNNGLVAILGPSGCGKTTLLNVIGGLDNISTGEIYVNNKRMTRVSTRKKDKIRNSDIGYIFQDFYLIDDMTVYDNVSLVLKMIGLKDKSEIKKRVDYVLTTLGIYKYRKRLAGMLSGGERQRVAIARAIVKNPSIIIADEPTGNLDSKNTIEIMNIIKSISKDKLVILVTHEKNIAHFYASRIIELVDGKIVNDYDNTNVDELDYRIDSKIYLQDIKNHEEVTGKNVCINYYSDNKSKINIDIVSKNGNIYIKTNKNVELVNEDDIEFINDKYKKITKDEYLSYKFDYKNILNNNFKTKYASIYNVFSMFKNGFDKLKSYSTLKKILLVGFFVSSMFVLYSVCNIAGVLDIKDSEFVTHNKNYLQLETNNIDKDKYLSYESNELINYVLPGSSDINFKVKYNFYYQTNDAMDTLTGSLSSINMISEADLVYGTMPSNEYEIVVDEMSIKNMYNNYTAIQVGLIEIEDAIGLTVELSNMSKFKIVGITNLQSPSIYMSESLFINALSNSYSDNIYEYTEASIVDYELKNDIVLKEGRLPNDYEIIVNIKEKDKYPINKTIDLKVSDTKLKVVGYYESIDTYLILTNENTIKYKLIDDSKNIIIYPKDKEQTISWFNENNINIRDIYSIDRDEYINEHKDTIISSFIVAFIILLISLVEIYLMIRSSFLSRIKEVGVKRAIGVKKTDIYKMFLGEILAITLTASMLGFLFMGYIVKGLTDLPLIKNNYIFNVYTILITLIIIFGFNILVGLIPVISAIRKTPHQILSRKDAD